MKKLKLITHVIMTLVITFGMLSTSMVLTKANTERKINYNVPSSYVPFIYCNSSSLGTVKLTNGETVMPSDTYSVTAYFVNSKIEIDRDKTVVKNGDSVASKSWGSANSNYYTTLNFTVDSTSDVTIDLAATYKRNFTVRARKIITGDEKKANELEASLKKRPATYQLYNADKTVYLEGTIDTAINSYTNFVHWSQANGGKEYIGADDSYISNLPNGEYTVIETDSGGNLITDDKTSTSVWLNSSYMKDDGGKKYYTFTVSDETVNTWMKECALNNQGNSLFYGFYTNAKETNYNVSYDGNGSDQGTMSSHRNLQLNDTINLFENRFVRWDYTFTGWNTVKNPTVENPGVQYDDKSTFTVIKEDTVLYAQWRKNIKVQHDVYVKDLSKENTELVLANSKKQDDNTLAYDATTLQQIVTPYITQGYAYTGYTIEIKDKNEHEWHTYDSAIEIKDGASIRYILSIDKDKAQTKTLSYTVEYWLEGETSPRDTLTVAQLVWIKEVSTMLSVKEITLPNYEGYAFSHYEPTQIPSLIENDSIIKVMYTKSEVTPPLTPDTPDKPVLPETPNKPVLPETPTTPVQPVIVTPTAPMVVTPTAPVVQAVQTPLAQPENTVIEDTKTPKNNGNTEVIKKEVTPKSSGQTNGSWALINLICTIAAVLITILALFLKHQKEEEDEEQDCKEQQQTMYQRRRWTKLVSAIVAIAMVIIFILTEDMTLPMILVDKWTFLMVALAIVQIVVYFIGRHWKQNDKNDNKVAYN